MSLKELNTRLAADAGIDIEIYHPVSGESLGIVITMQGSDSQAYIDAERKVANRIKEHAKRTRDFTVGLDYDQQNSALVEKMAACFVSWREGGKPTLQFEEGVDLEATPDNFRKLITDRGFFWLRQQVQAGMDNVTNFLPQGASSSLPQHETGSVTTDQTKTG